MESTTFVALRMLLTMMDNLAQDNAVGDDPAD